MASGALGPDYAMLVIAVATTFGTSVLFLWFDITV